MGMDWIHSDAGFGKKLVIKVPPRKSLDISAPELPAPVVLEAAPVPHLKVVEFSENPNSEDGVLLQETGDINDHYVMGKELGKGHFGVVRQCLDRRTFGEYACKSISKANLKKKEEIKELQAEIGVMQHLAGHVNVVQLRDVFEDSEAVHLVMELCKEGDLFDLIARRRRLPEAEAANLFRQIVLAVQYCHSRGVVHRDLKPENILLAKGTSSGKGGPELLVKLADFGLAVMVKPGEQATGLAGSPFYMAPELIRRRPYGPEIDNWSLGVILYTALSGFLPFWGKSHEQTFAAVCRGEADFAKKPWQIISPEAKSLVRKLLTMDPRRRGTIEDILNHPWMLAHCHTKAHRQKVQPLAPASERHLPLHPTEPVSPRDYGPNPYPVPQALSAPKGRFSPPRTPSPQSSPRAAPVKPSFSQFLPTPPGTPRNNGEQSHITPFAAALFNPVRMFLHKDRTKEVLASPQSSTSSVSAQTTPRPFFLRELHEKRNSTREGPPQQVPGSQKGKDESAGVEMEIVVDGRTDPEADTEETKRISASSSSGCARSGQESPRSHFDKLESPAGKETAASPRGKMSLFAAHIKDFVI